MGAPMQGEDLIVWADEYDNVVGRLIGLSSVAAGTYSIVARCERYDAVNDMMIAELVDQHRVTK